MSINFLPLFSLSSAVKPKKWCRRSKFGSLDNSILSIYGVRRNHRLTTRVYLNKESHHTVGTWTEVKQDWKSGVPMTVKFGRWSEYENTEIKTTGFRSYIPTQIIAFSAPWEPHKPLPAAIYSPINSSLQVYPSRK